MSSLHANQAECAINLVVSAVTWSQGVSRINSCRGLLPGDKINTDAKFYLQHCVRHPADHHMTILKEGDLREQGKMTSWDLRDMRDMRDIRGFGLSISRSLASTEVAKHPYPHGLHSSSVLNCYLGTSGKPFAGSM